MDTETKAKITELMMRIADGDVSDDDMAWLMSNLPEIGGDLQGWIQKLVDEPHEQRNARLLLSLWTIYQTFVE